MSRLTRSKTGSKGDIMCNKVISPDMTPTLDRSDLVLHIDGFYTDNPGFFDDMTFELNVKVLDINKPEGKTLISINELDRPCTLIDIQEIDIALKFNTNQPNTETLRGIRYLVQSYDSKSYAAANTKDRETIGIMLNLIHYLCLVSQKEISDTQQAKKAKVDIKYPKQYMFFFFAICNKINRKVRPVASVIKSQLIDKTLTYFKDTIRNARFTSVCDAIKKVEKFYSNTEQTLQAKIKAYSELQEKYQTTEYQDIVVSDALQECSESEVKSILYITEDILNIQTKAATTIQSEINQADPQNSSSRSDQNASSVSSTSSKVDENVEDLYFESFYKDHEDFYINYMKEAITPHSRTTIDAGTVQGVPGSLRESKSIMFYKILQQLFNIGNTIFEPTIAFPESETKFKQFNGNRIFLKPDAEFFKDISKQCYKSYLDYEIEKHQNPQSRRTLIQCIMENPEIENILFEYLQANLTSTGEMTDLLCKMTLGGSQFISNMNYFLTEFIKSLSTMRPEFMRIKKDQGLEHAIKYIIKYYPAHIKLSDRPEFIQDPKFKEQRKKLHCIVRDSFYNLFENTKIELNSHAAKLVCKQIKQIYKQR